MQLLLEKREIKLTEINFNVAFYGVPCHQRHLLLWISSYSKCQFVHVGSQGWFDSLDF